MMKSVKKAIIAALCAGTLVVGSVAGTMAYLTSSDEVTNTFTVGNVAITLDEAQVGTDGKALTGDAAERVKRNSYKLMPGHEYDKDPRVTVATTSENCYLFVKVDNQITAIESTEEDKSVAAQMAAKGWSAVEGQTGVYVYTKENALAVVKGGDKVPVFDKFTVDGTTVDNDKLATYEGKTITVTAYAVQADGFDNKTASEIWTAANFQ